MSKAFSVRQMMNDKASRAYLVFTSIIQGLILLSLITFSVDTLPNLSPQISRWLFYCEAVTVAIFTLEYALRIYYAPRKLTFIFSFWGLVDLMAILPFYITTGLDLRSIRVLRFIRLVRILKLFKYSSALKRIYDAFKLIKEELIIFVFAASLMLYLSAVGIYYFEHHAQPQVFQSVFHSLWWAITTLTTVGYGDMYPVTAGGKAFTFIVLMIGLGIIAVPTSLLAAALTQVKVKEENRHQK